MKKGEIMPPEQRAKISAAQKGKPRKARSPEAIEKGAAQLRGRKQPLELRAKWSGPNHHAWKGGRQLEENGYVSILVPGHPSARRQGYVLEHRLVMERHIGRPLHPEEIVHHINEITNDNRIENLMLFPNRAAHLRHHAGIRKMMRESRENC